tara:strand:+ start:40632 stop:41240 length:609 start_codon:yes stop_codon:yes gene_type:complete
MLVTLVAFTLIRHIRVLYPIEQLAAVAISSGATPPCLCLVSKSAYRRFNQESWRKPMRYLHTMVRVTDVDASLDFYCNKLGLEEIRRQESEAGRFTLIFLAAPDDKARALADKAPMVELTYNWDPEEYQGGRNFGHLAYEVDNIYELCQHMLDNGVTINRPPRDGHMAFVRSPDGISIELLQKGDPLDPAEPWASMKNTGAW